jgi:hypothetical protein
MTFAIAYSPFYRLLLAPLGLGPRWSRVRVDADTVHVRMGWGFHAAIPRAAIRGVRTEARLPFLGWGVHGWKGRWLVNGASRGLVRLDLQPGQRARVMGIPVKLRELWISVEHPDQLVAALGDERR